MAESKNEKSKGTEQEKKIPTVSGAETTTEKAQAPEKEIVSENAETEIGKTVKVGEGSKKDESLVDIMYEKINEAIGGDNANQYFCMTFPATLLAKETYEYDYKSGKSKPLTVEMKESRLANKMFDPCNITGADNGRSLAQQYSSALDMLTPKLNQKIQEAKTNLRDMLM